MKNSKNRIIATLLAANTLITAGCTIVEKDKTANEETDAEVVEIDETEKRYELIASDGSTIILEDATAEEIAEYLSQETLEKESELLNLENEINIYYNKLFSDYIHTDNNKRIILSKLKLIREELTQRKYTDYLNKKIMVEQKEDKIQKELSKLSTEQLEVFNNEIFNIQKYNNKDNPNIEAMKKHYEDIKKSDIYQKIFSEIKDSLYNEKNNTQSMGSFYNNKKDKTNKKFNSKMINESSNYFQPYSMRYSGMRSEMFSNSKKKKKINNSMDTKYNISNENFYKNEDYSNQKYLIDSKNIRNKSFGTQSYAYKKKKRFNSKLFMANNNNS